MNLDWLTTLGVADQGMDAQLAKRSLQKNAALVQNLAKMTEDVRSAKASEELRRQQIEEQTLLRKATLDQTKAYRDQNEEDRKKAEDFTRYNGVVDNYRAGAGQGVTQTITDPAIHDLIVAHEGSGAMTPMAAGEGPGQGSGEGTASLPGWYYQKELAEKIALKAEQEQKRQAHSQKLQDENMALANQREKREQAQEADRVKREEQNRTLREQRIQKANKDTSAFMDPITKAGLTGAVTRRAKEIMNEHSGLWATLTGADRDVNEAEAWAQAADDVYQEGIKNGRIHPGPNPVSREVPGGGARMGGAGGRGGQPGGGAGTPTVTRYDMNGNVIPPK
jgi:hypothetical protein